MKVIAVASQKGGSGKTTISSNLAVAAAIEGHAVAVLDTDAQGSLTTWWNRRGQESPALVRADGDPAAIVRRLQAAGDGFAFVDTPPSTHEFVGAVIREADFVLVPVRPSPHDLAAIGTTIGMLRGRRWCFVLSQTKPRSRLTLETTRALAKHGQIAPVHIGDRTEFAVSAASGKAVVETTPTGPGSDEIKTLLTYVIQQLHNDVLNDDTE